MTVAAELVETAVVTVAVTVAVTVVVTVAAALVFSGLDVVIGDPTPDTGPPLSADPPHAPSASSKPTTSKATVLGVTSLTPCVGVALPKPPAPNSPNMRCCWERVIAMMNTFSKRDPRRRHMVALGPKDPVRQNGQAQPTPGNSVRPEPAWQRPNRRTIRIQGQRSARSREPFGLCATIRAWLSVRDHFFGDLWMTPRSKVSAMSAKPWRFARCSTNVSTPKGVVCGGHGAVEADDARRGLSPLVQAADDAVA